MLRGLVEPRLFARMSRIPAHSSTARTGPRAITPGPERQGTDVAGRPAPSPRPARAPATAGPPAAPTATTTAPAPAGAARPAWGPALLGRCRRGGGRGRGRGRDFRSRCALALRR